MAGVETYADSFRLRDVLQDGPQMLEAVSKGRPLPCGGFEQDADSESGAAPMRLVECLNDSLQPDLFSVPEVRAGMGHKVTQPQCFGSHQFLDERLDRAAVQRWVRRGEVDEVRVVGRRKSQPGPAQGRTEELDILGRDRPTRP